MVDVVVSVRPAKVLGSDERVDQDTGASYINFTPELLPLLELLYLQFAPFGRIGDVTRFLVVQLLVVLFNDSISLDDVNIFPQKYLISMKDRSMSVMILSG